MKNQHLLRTGLMLVGSFVVGGYLLKQFSGLKAPEAPETPPDEEGVVNFGGYRRLGNGHESDWANAGWRSRRAWNKNRRQVKKILKSGPGITQGWSAGGGDAVRRGSSERRVSSGGGQAIVSPHSGTFVTSI